MGGVAFVVLKVLGIEHRVNGIACAFIQSGKDCANARYATVVILDRLGSRLRRIARGNRSGKDQHVFTRDRLLDIIAEDQLTSHGMLGLDDINGLVRVEVDKGALGQLIGKTRANDLGTVKTQHRIYDGVCGIVGNQLLGNRLGLGKTGLLRRHIYIIIDMAMAGSKMSLGYTQEQISVFGTDLIRFFGWHDKNPFFFIIPQRLFFVK